MPFAIKLTKLYNSIPLSVGCGNLLRRFLGFLSAFFVVIFFRRTFEGFLIGEMLTSRNLPEKDLLIMKKC